MSDDLGNRNFYKLPANTSKAAPLNSSATPDELFKLIRENEIGRNHLFISAFGKRSLTYCDHTASGRPLEERFVRETSNYFLISKNCKGTHKSSLKILSLSRFFRLMQIHIQHRLLQAFNQPYSVMKVTLASAQRISPTL